MNCNFQLSMLIVFFVILRLSPSLLSKPLNPHISGDPPYSVRFAPACLKVKLCEVAATSKFSHLRPLRSVLTI